MKLKWPVVELGAPAFVRAAETRLMCTVDPEMYHQAGTSSEDAAELCRGCVCLLECRAYGLENRESGVWGGWTQQQRDAERARREVEAV